MGIVNGTTNYILTKMDEEGQSYEAALKKRKNSGLQKQIQQQMWKGWTRQGKWPF